MKAEKEAKEKAAAEAKAKAEKEAKAKADAEAKAKADAAEKLLKLKRIKTLMISYPVAILVAAVQVTAEIKILQV